MAGLFISYRRQDAAGQAGRLRDALAARYGTDRVFHDVASLLPGEQWATELQAAAGASDALLVVIGPHWLDARSPAGDRRIDDPHDFVRAEVGHALQEGKLVVPVLVGQARLPGPQDLPEDLRGLVERQAVQLGDETWDRDLLHLFEALDRVLGRRARGPRGVPSRLPDRAYRSPSPKAGLGSRLVSAYRVLVGREPAPGAADPSPSPRTGPAHLHAARPAPLEDGEPQHSVFVSYASADEALADEVARAVEGSGYRCWISHRDIPPGSASYAEPIVTAIANSRLALTLLTVASNASIDVLREVTIAADEKIPLLGVTLDGSRPSAGLRYFFGAGQRLDVTGAARAERDTRIVNAAMRHLPAV